MFAIVFFHDTLVTKAQIYFGTVGSANRGIIIWAFGLAFAFRRNRCRASRLHLVAVAHFLVTSWCTIHGDQHDCQALITVMCFFFFRIYFLNTIIIAVFSLNICRKENNYFEGTYLQKQTSRVSEEAGPFIVFNSGLTILI